MIAGRYRLEAPLGRGAMGEIWRAEHVRLKSHVAVKFLDASIADDPEMLDRFLREAQSAAAVRSTHVVQIFDCGVEAGAPYISMELLQGESLDARLSQRVWLSPEELNKIFAEVTLAIGNAHKMGVIHRDLKPGNIFLVREGELELTKVLDFGIAKVMSQNLSQTSGLGTRTGTLLGTPHYMSPEQARGSRDVDQSTDLWSLAIIAYECLTGQQPFSGSSLGDIVVRICTEEPPAPSTVADVPAGFDAWFAKGASKKPSDRFASAREMADALSAVLLGQEAAAMANRTLVLAGTGTQHAVPIPLTRREPAGSAAVASSGVSSSPGTSSAVVASGEGRASSSLASLPGGAGAREAAASAREAATSARDREHSLGGSLLLAAHLRSALAHWRSSPPVLGLLHAGAALARWWSAAWSWFQDVLRRALEQRRSGGEDAPHPAGERWRSRERWVLMVSLLCSAAVLSFWYSAKQRGSSLPPGERTAVASPLGGSSPDALAAPAASVPEPRPEAPETRAANESATAREPSSRELVAGTERRPARSVSREPRRVESSTAALQPGRVPQPGPVLQPGPVQARQTGQAAPTRPAPRSSRPPSRSNSKLSTADPFAERL
jgi:serine/threonine-protein kinase